MTISIYKFLLRYYGILLDINVKYSHKELKKDFPILKRCSFEHAINNPYLVGIGKIIYVNDSFGNVVPYICPKEISCIDNDFLSLDKKDDYDKQSDDELIEKISEIPTYVVRQLLSKYKIKPSFYKIIKDELVRRGIYQNKIYKINKEIDKMELEESDLNDKCKRRRKIKCN